MSWIRFPRMMAGSTLGEVGEVDEDGVEVVEEGEVEEAVDVEVDAVVDGGEVDPVEEMGVGVVTKVAEEEGGVEAVLTKCLMLGDHYLCSRLITLKLTNSYYDDQ
jgi:hypothetical protein